MTGAASSVTRPRLFFCGYGEMNLAGRDKWMTGC